MRLRSIVLADSTCHTAAALESYDHDTLASIDDRTYQSGTSEVKFYAALLTVMQPKMTLADYVPCYRTETGTGEGMGFMYWLA